MQSNTELGVCHLRCRDRPWHGARLRLGAPDPTARAHLRHLPFARRGAGVVERGGLENRCALAGTVGSNPTLSAIIPVANTDRRLRRRRNSRVFKGLCVPHANRWDCTPGPFQALNGAPSLFGRTYPARTSRSVSIAFAWNGSATRERRSRRANGGWPGGRRHFVRDPGEGKQIKARAVQNRHLIDRCEAA